MNILLYNGERKDPITGVYYLGNATGPTTLFNAFNIQDSMSPFEAGGIYCSGDPINRSDPSGHFSWSNLMSFTGIALSVFGISSAIWSLGSSLTVVGCMMVNAKPLDSAYQERT